MGDKSPKSKERGQKQKAVATAKGAVQAKTKQDAYNQIAKNASKMPKAKK